MYWTFINQRQFQQCFVKNLVEQAFEKHNFTLNDIAKNCRQHKGDSQKLSLGLTAPRIKDILSGATYKTFADFYWKDVCLHNNLIFRDIMLLAMSDYVYAIRDKQYIPPPGKELGANKPAKKTVPIKKLLDPKKKNPYLKKKKIVGSEHPLSTDANKINI